MGDGNSAFEILAPVDCNKVAYKMTYGKDLTVYQPWMRTFCNNVMQLCNMEP